MKFLIIVILTFLTISPSAFALMPTSHSKSDEVVSFVRNWFNLFDDNKDIIEFQKKMVDKNLYMKFPETTIRSNRNFRKWYSNIKKNFSNPSHDIREIKVNRSLTGNYIVNLVVIWKATNIKTKKIIRFEARQIWEIIKIESSLKIKSYYVQQNNRFFNPLVPYLKHLKIPTFGGFVVENGTVTESMALPGLLDFIWIEAEHSTLSEREVSEIVRTAENEKLSSIIRVHKNDPDIIKRYIGTGADGIIVPSIKTKRDAIKAVNATKYAPLGNRPAGVERGNRYLGLFDEYKSVANNEVLLILMIETKEAVKNIEDIVKVKGIDILHIGPYDLSLSMGVAMNSKELKNAIQKVENIAIKYDIPLGSYAKNKKSALEKYTRGYRFFTIPDSMSMIREGVKQFFNEQ